MQAMLSEMMSEPYDPDEKFDDKKYDPDAAKCKGYNRGQQEACECVGEDQWQDSTNEKLKAFYSKFNPEKLDKKGQIKDLDDVWKKWKGKEAEMFLALATKYKDKAVEIRVKPKPPPYTPPKEDKKKDDEESSEASETEETVPSPPPEEAAEDTEFEEFAKKKKGLSSRKRKAAEDEEYDRAQEIKEEMEALQKKEADRLTALKKKAIEDEDYAEAKKLKAKLAKLEDL
jgi:hypothetical protein